MKKIFSLVCLISILSIGVAGASETNTTYTERFINKHAQKLINTEKNITAKQKAQKEKYEAQKKAQKEKQAEQAKKLDAKKKAWKELTTF